MQVTWKEELIIKISIPCLCLFYFLPIHSSAFSAFHLFPILVFERVKIFLILSLVPTEGYRSRENEYSRIGSVSFGLGVSQRGQIFQSPMANCFRCLYQPIDHVSIRK